ncbi:hypothetical protein PKOR_15930 [Pontibacter korlensis]|uniref:Uncharacterized protein n=1 Tax=Pontibacter korlensis TaxID=400092 RepID=A0A0E3UYB5_9BACT|nr:hypothetical protein [Pontibacter korlensis]AKD04306.1 hypothetical protein PKOR_15930 [Pontibacter korlensis]
MTQEEFLIQHLTEDKSYQSILNENKGLELPKIQEWWATGTELRNKIKRSNALFSSRKGKPAFTAFEQAGFLRVVP